MWKSQLRTVTKIDQQIDGTNNLNKTPVWLKTLLDLSASCQWHKPKCAIIFKRNYWLNLGKSVFWHILFIYDFLKSEYCSDHLNQHTQTTNFNTTCHSKMKYEKTPNYQMYRIMWIKCHSKGKLAA